MGNTSSHLRQERDEVFVSHFEHGTGTNVSCSCSSCSLPTMTTTSSLSFVKSRIGISSFSFLISSFFFSPFSFSSSFFNNFIEDSCDVRLDIPLKNFFLLQQQCNTTKKQQITYHPILSSPRSTRSLSSRSFKSSIVSNNSLLNLSLKASKPFSSKNESTTVLLLVKSSLLMISVTLRGFDTSVAIGFEMSLIIVGVASSG